MNLIYPTGFGRCPSDAVRARADTLRALEQPTASLSDQYRANTGPAEPTSMGSIWITHNFLRAQNRRKPISESSTCSSFTHGLYDPIRIQQSSKYRTNPQRGHAPSLVRVLAMRLIGKEGHKVSSYKQQSLIKLSWAHMPFRVCRAQVAYFHINSLLTLDCKLEMTLPQTLGGILQT